MRRFNALAMAIFAMSPAFALAAENATVRVLPFTEADEHQPADWIDRAVAQSVSDDLASVASVQVISADASQARYIVRGSIQRLNGSIRVSGQVLDTVAGKSVGGFKATAPETMIFAVEDSIGRQVKEILSPSETPSTSPAPAPALENPQPIANAQQPRGEFEGSELQRAMRDRDYILRQMTQRPAPTYGETAVTGPYVPATYPVGYGNTGSYTPYSTLPYNYGYNGYGYGYGYGGWGFDHPVVIINQSHNGGHHGGHGGHSGGGHSGSGDGIGGGGGGGVTIPSTPSVPIAVQQTQALREASVGGFGNVAGPTPARAPIANTRRPLTLR